MLSVKECVDNSPGKRIKLSIHSLIMQGEDRKPAKYLFYLHSSEKLLNVQFFVYPYVFSMRMICTSAIHGKTLKLLETPSITLKPFREKKIVNINVIGSGSFF